MSGSLVTLSNDLAAAVERGAGAVVAVHGRQRLASTGIHWRPGVVITADHTVTREDDLSVTPPDGRTLGAVLTGRDPSTDIAVLGVRDADGPTAELAAAAALRIGHVVLGLGHGPRVSWGIISAIGGEWQTWRGGRVDRLLRLDITLYPGFSGGPLIDAHGSLIGMNTSGLSRHMALAIPHSTLTRVVDELISTGHVVRGYLGLGLQPARLPETLRSRVAGTGEVGLVVVNLQTGGPAANGGLLIGDVVIALDGRSVSAPEDVQAIVGSSRAGTSLRLSIIRGGEPREITVTVGERPRSRR